MIITILTTGSLGDVLPLLALAIDLNKMGHVVRMAVPPNFRSLVESHGIEYSLLGVDTESTLRDFKARSIIESGRSLSFIIYRIRKKQQLFDLINFQAFEACRDCELIIHRRSELIAAFSIAQKIGIPFVEVCVAPIVRTRSFPSLYFYGSPNLGGAYNWVTHVLAEQILWQISHRSTNKLRRNVLGIDALPATGPEKLKREYGVPILHPFSPSVVTKPVDWPDWAYITGYWFLDGMEGWQPPDALVKFIESGPPPVYIGFGSMPSQNPLGTFELITKALQVSGHRAILATGWGGITSPSKSSDKYFILESAPHEWLFPRMSVVVHHGGLSTTAAGIRAGVPTIIIPHNFDQPFWGQTVAELGVGPKPIPRKRLSSDNLAQAIDLAISDKNMRRQAEELGRRVRAEDGIGTAVNLIHQYSRK